jgi:hypothetical protein
MEEFPHTKGIQKYGPPLTMGTLMESSDEHKHEAVPLHWQIHFMTFLMQ